MISATLRRGHRQNIRMASLKGPSVILSTMSQPAAATVVSVCICTYRRPQRLALLLGDLARQTRLPDEVVVVDNDAAGSARATVESLTETLPFALRYSIQPQKNISLTRNQAMKTARGDWLAMLDDDERAPAHWLATMLVCASRFDAGMVIAPVVCEVPDSAPEWIKQGNFYAQPRYATGTVIRNNVIGLGNVLLDAKHIADMPVPCDPAYGLTGGEDLDFIARLEAKGCKLVWCDDAVVTEEVEPSRLDAGWILRRAKRGGQTFAHLTLAGRYGELGVLDKAMFFARSGVQVVMALLLALLMLPLGRHRAFHWLGKAVGNAAKFSALWGAHHKEYG